jgi:hypothetical protein
VQKENGKLSVISLTGENEDEESGGTGNGEYF